jgi:hypothetical protein
MRQTEHVLYITLIDFLLQLIFLGLLVGVIYSLDLVGDEAKADAVGAKEAIETIEKLRALTGISDITKLTDELTRMAPLQDNARYAKIGKDLDGVVGGVGGVDAAMKILAEQVTRRGGQDLPSCLPRGAFLATFDAYLDRLELRSPGGDMLEVLKKLNLSYDDAKKLTRLEFQKVFSPITKVEPTCRYYVTIFEHTYDNRSRDAVGSAFYFRSIPAGDRE